MAKLNVFVGYDSREDDAWEVCRHSLLRYAGGGIDVFPLRQTELRARGLYYRAADVAASTEFSLTRFLVPHLAGSEWSVFVDCDFLFTTDIRKVLELIDRTKAVYVVKHSYNPRFAEKMDGRPQHHYNRKNWSSFIVFNGTHPDVRRLTPALVNSATPAFLHQFEWISDPESIGELPLEWNFLVGEYERPAALPAGIHFTNGGPWFAEWTNHDFADLWLAEREATFATQRMPGMIGSQDT